MMDTLNTALLIAFTAMACYSDICFRKIDNRLTLPFLLLGLFNSTLQRGWPGLGISIAGVVTGFVILLLPFEWGWVGGGDIKLMAAAGAFLGLSRILYAALVGLILFGIAGTVHLAVNGRLKKFLDQLIWTICSFQNGKGINLIEVSGRLPLGVFLGVGILLVWFDVLSRLKGGG